jgi:hypothetical protein
LYTDCSEARPRKWRAFAVSCAAARSQPAKAVLARLADVQRRQTSSVRAVLQRDVQLGGQHHLVATRRVISEPAAEDRLRGAGAVDIGGVKEVDARLERSVHDRTAVLLIGVPAEVHRAQREATYLGAYPAELGVLHVDLLFGCAR